MSRVGSTPAAAGPFPAWIEFGLVGGIALVARLAVLAYRLGGHFDLDGVSWRAYGGPDVPGWLALGRHFADGGGLEHRLLAFRPPLFPLSVAAVDRLGGGDPAALLLQTLCSAATVLVGYRVARLLLGRAGVPQARAGAALAALVLALDPASVWSGTTLMSEPLFNLLVALLLLAVCESRARGGWGWTAAAAAFTMGAMLTRPTAIYLWVVAPAMLLVPRPRRWRAAVAVVLAGLVVYAGWSARNRRYVGIPTYSTHTAFTLLFYRALSAEHLATGRSVAELQTEYVRSVYRRADDPRAEDPVTLDTSDTPGDMWRFQVAESPAIHRALRALAAEKLLRYWRWAVGGTFVGAWRMMMVTRGPPIPSWFAVPEILYHLSLYGACLVGAWWALRRRRWELLVVCAVPILYVSAVTLASQTSAMDTRMRTPMTLPIVILAVTGIAAGASRRRPRAEHREP